MERVAAVNVDEVPEPATASRDTAGSVQASVLADGEVVETDKLAQARVLLENLCKNHIDGVNDPNLPGPSTGEKKGVSDFTRLRDQIWELFSPDKTDIAYLESPAFRNKIRLIEHGCVKQPRKKKLHLKELIESMLVNKPKTEEERKRVQVNRERQVKNSKEKLIEALGKRLDQTIAEINMRERENGFEDDSEEDSVKLECNYLYVDRLKRRAIELYNKLQELECNSTSLMRESRRPIIVKTTPYPEVNKAAGKMATRCMRKDLTPDFCDVLTVVRRVNESENLGMSAEKQRSVGVEVFKEIVEKIKKRRVTETRLNIESLEIEFLEKEETDPAEKDAELEARLKASEVEGRERITAVINEFADKQISTDDKEIAKEDLALPKASDAEANGGAPTVQDGSSVTEHADVEKSGGGSMVGSNDESDDEDKPESEVDESYLLSDDGSGEESRASRATSQQKAVPEAGDDGEISELINIDLDGNKNSEKFQGSGASDDSEGGEDEGVEQEETASEQVTATEVQAVSEVRSDQCSDPESSSGSSKHSQDMIYIESLADDDSSPPARTNGCHARSKKLRPDSQKRPGRRFSGEGPAAKRTAVIELSDDSIDSDEAFVTTSRSRLLSGGSSLAGKLRALGTNVVPIKRPCVNQSPEVIEIDSD